MNTRYIKTLLFTLVGLIGAWQQTEAQNPTLLNPSACGMNLVIPDSSCNSTNRFPILVENEIGTRLGSDIFLEEVRLIIAHTWVADLDISLFSPNGIKIELSTDNGADNDNYGDPSDGACGAYISFNANACNDFRLDSLPPYIGSYQPEGNLLDFNDFSDPNGQWVLEICDDAGDDAGTLEFVELVFAPVGCFAPTEVSVISQDSTTITLDWTSNGLCETTIIEYGPVGFTPGVDRMAGENGAVVRTGCPPFQLMDLAPNATYEIYIREACTESVFSSNACPIVLTTSCLPGSLSLVENFDEQSDCNTICGRSCELTGTWNNSQQDDFDWLVKSGVTPSANTGPTTDVEGDGKYIYLETSGSQCRNGNQAILQSSCIEIDTTASTTCHFSFNYHLWGATIATLKLELTEDGGATWKSLWSISGDQGNQWRKQYIDLFSWHGKIVQFRFVGAGGASATGDMALDNLVFYGSRDLGSADFTYYADMDEDGFGDANQPIFSCAAAVPLGFVNNDLDCDDTNANISPNAVEVTCNGIDENCNGMEDDAALPPPSTNDISICRGEMATVTASPPTSGFILWFGSPNGNDFLFFDEGSGYTFPTDDIQDSITLYAEAWLGVDCQSIERTAVTIRVNPSPELVSSSLPIICEGQSVDLTDLTILDVSGLSDSIRFHAALPATAENQLKELTVFPTKTTTYYAVASSSQACETSIPVKVNVGNTANVQITPSDTIAVCGGSTQLLSIQTTDTTGLNYLWNTGETSEDIEVVSNPTPGTVTAYTLTTFNQEGCTTRDTVWVRTSLGIESARIIPQEVSNCGGDDGSLTIEPLGGVAPYSYFWSGQEEGNATGAASSFTISDLSQGIYRVTVVDNSLMDCRIQLPFSIVNGPNAKVEVAEIQHISCPNGSDGRIVLDLKGEKPDIEWSTGDNSSVLEDLTAGAYSVTITEGDCATILSDIVVKAPEPISIFALTDLPTCHDSADGSIDLTIAGGTAPYLTVWEDIGLGLENRKNIVGGFYPIQIRDANNCVYRDTVDLTPPDSLQIVAQTKQDISCAGLTNGNITVAGLGGTAPYFYEWDNEQYTNQLQQLEKGDYELTITDVNGCTNSQIFTIVEPAPLKIQLDSIRNASCPGVGDGLLKTSALGGTAPYTFEWSNRVEAALNPALEASQYILRLFDDNGCRAIDTFNISAPPAINLSTSVNAPKCIGNQTGSIQLNVENTVISTYEWDDGGDSGLRDSLGVGDYAVTLTDEVGCKLDTVFTLEAPQLLEVTVSQRMPTCANSSDARIDLDVINQNGLSPKFLWNTGRTEQNLSDLQPASYIATITDDDACTLVTDTIVIEAPNPIDIIIDEVTNVPCAGDASGAIEVSVIGGLPPYRYSWSTGVNTEDIYDLEEGAYTLAVVDSNECAVSTKSINIFEPSPLQLNFEIVQEENCAIADDELIDSLVLSVTGGIPDYRYEWNNGEESKDLLDIETGDYSVTVTDRNECVASLPSIKVKPPNSGFTVALEKQNITCTTANDGTLFVKVNGGQAPYLYHLSSGTITTQPSDTFRFEGLAAGDYRLTVTDNFGCSVIENNIFVTEPASLTIQLEEKGVQNVKCAGESTGGIFIEASGGFSPYTFEWRDGLGNLINQTEDLVNAIGGTYSVAIIDARNCISDPRVFNIQEPSFPIEISSLDITNIVCFGDTTGQIKLNVTGGIPPYSYSWNDSLYVTKNLNNIPAGIYQLSVLDQNGCLKLLDSLEVQEAVAPIELSDTLIQDASCWYENDGNISVEVIGGIAPYNLFWRSSDMGNEYINGNVTFVEALIAGNYIVNVQDSLGCNRDFQLTVDAPEAIEAIMAVTPTLPNRSTGKVEAIVSGGTAPYIYNWSIPDSPNEAKLSNLPKGNYQLTLTDAQSCIQVVNFEIKEDIMDKLEQIEGLTQFELTPNPSDGQFKVAVTFTTPRFHRIRVVNSLGQVVQNSPLFRSNNHFYAFDLSQQAKGLYWVQLEVEGVTIGKMIILQ